MRASLSSLASGVLRGPRPVRRLGPLLATILAAMLASVLIPGLARAQDADAAAEAPLPVHLYIFHGDGCPHCADALAFLDELGERHPTLRVHDFEVWYDEENLELLSELATAYGRTVQGVPVIFLGDEMWTGFGPSVERDLRLRVDQYERVRAPDPMARIGRTAGGGLPGATDDAAPPASVDGQGAAPLPRQERTLDLPLVGTVDLERTSLLMSTALIALVDGVNPCSLWVLALLLGVVLGTGTTSRRRVLIIGATFLAITAIVYAAFVAGVFEILAYLSLLGWIRVAVAILALAIAAINLKDYVAFGRGPSLTIDDSAKPGIYKGIRAIMKAEGSWTLTLGATAALALGVTLVELPCTIGLPVVWGTLLADAGVSRGTFGGLLGLYMTIYLLDELVIFGAAVITLKATRLDESGGRILKLLGGAVMLALALAMLAQPEALSSLRGTALVFAAALGGTALVLVTHRIVHPASSPWPASPERD